MCVCVCGIRGSDLIEGPEELPTLFLRVHRLHFLKHRILKSVLEPLS